LYSSKIIGHFIYAFLQECRADKTEPVKLHITLTAKVEKFYSKILSAAVGIGAMLSNAEFIQYTPDTFG
jgi:hypothetical protein